MGSLFKRTDRGGRSGNWYAQYIDEHGQRTVPVSTRTSDKEAAKRILAKWEADAALRRTGVIDSVAERIGNQARRPIAEHISEFRSSIESPGNTDKHVLGTIQILERVIGIEGWRALADISMESVERYSSHLRELKRSNRTIQKHLHAIKQFTKWAHEHKRIPVNPLAILRTPDPETDRRLERRALHPDEWPLLRAAAGTGPTTTTGLTGPDRALLYELTIQTGLRQNEVRELTAGKLHLDQKPPFVLLPSRSTKNKKPARQYITARLGRQLRAFAKKRGSGAALFDLPHVSTVAKMARNDLAIARAAWVSEGTKRQQKQRANSDFLAPVNHEGLRFDFHSLRHTCGAWLAMAGENPKTIQTIMRHSTITLTMDTYGHLFPAAESDAIARLGRRHFG